MDIDYRGITVEISSITAVTPQQATPSPRYYRKFHLQNRGVTTVLPPSPLPRRALFRIAVTEWSGERWKDSVTLYVLWSGSVTRVNWTSMAQWSVQTAGPATPDETADGQQLHYINEMESTLREYSSPRKRALGFVANTWQHLPRLLLDCCCKPTGDCLHFTEFFHRYFHIPPPIVTKHELDLPFPPRNLPIKFGTNPSTIFLVIVVTDRHTDRQTDRQINQRP